ncbi:MAG: ABC transporter transmembrane domain-containing protein [Acidobacteriota bacterium]
MKIASFFWRYFRRYLPTAGVALLAIVTFAVTSALVAALIEPIFAEVLQSEDGPSLLGVAEAEEGEKPSFFNAAAQFDRFYGGLKERFDVDEDNVYIFVPLLFGLVFLIRNLANFVSGYSFQRIGLGVMTDVRNDLYERILGQSSRFHSEHTSGELMARVVNDVSLMQNAVSNRLLDLFQQPLTLILYTALLLSTHFSLGIICLVVAPVLVYPIVRFGKGMRRTSHRSQERMADIASLMSEGVRGYRVVKSFGMEEFEHRRFSEATEQHKRVNLRAQLLSNLSSPVVESLAVVGSVALLIYAGSRIHQGEMSGPQLVMFLTTLMLMYDPIRKLNKVNLILQEALAAAHRVSGLMAVPNDIEERPGARHIDGVEQGVSYEGVSFGYEQQPVLEDIDLVIRRGEIVALVGASGAGKSTMVNLLSRFFDPDRGRLAIDGIDLRDLKLRSLRSLIGVVTQETVLFNESVRNNIAYGRDDLPLERVREAARAAFADDFVQDLPEGYETRIGEGGLRLSGGQRQRLSIARALLKDAPILVLDEATSQLDSESEALVQKALYNLMQGRTTLVIAHRLSTVMKADRIVVMEAGRMIEAGTHSELLALGGTYKRLYDLQFRE